MVLKGCCSEVLDRGPQVSMWLKEVADKIKGKR